MEVESLDIEADSETNGFRSKLLRVRYLCTTGSALDLEVSDKAVAGGAIRKIEMPGSHEDVADLADGVVGRDIVPDDSPFRGQLQQTLVKRLCGTVFAAHEDPDHGCQDQDGDRNQRSDLPLRQFRLPSSFLALSRHDSILR